MAPVTKPTEKVKKSWAEINRRRKEEKKKWKEQKLLKKINKQSAASTGNVKSIDNIPIKNELEPEIDSMVKDETESTIKEESKNNLNSGQIPTLSIAVPGSILENAQSAELRTYLAGQIARAACIFQVDEIIVFDDYGDEASAKKSTLEQDTGLISARKCCVQLGRILQYLECPQYLRKHFFPIHADLKYCGLLNPLNAPHHLKPDEEFPFRYFPFMILSKRNIVYQED